MSFQFCRWEIRLIDDLEHILKRAWSVRLMVAMLILQVAYELMPVFQDAIPRGYYTAVMSILITLTFLARVTKQPGYD